jgi:hypothetical protein
LAADDDRLSALPSREVLHFVWYALPAKWAVDEPELVETTEATAPLMDALSPKVAEWHRMRRRRRPPVIRCRSRCQSSGWSATMVSRPSSRSVRLDASADTGVAKTRMGYFEGSTYRYSISTGAHFRSSGIVADALRVLPGAHIRTYRFLDRMPWSER